MRSMPTSATCLAFRGTQDLIAAVAASCPPRSLGPLLPWTGAAAAGVRFSRLSCPEAARIERWSRRAALAECVVATGSQLCDVRNVRPSIPCQRP